MKYITPEEYRSINLWMEPKGSIRSAEFNSGVLVRLRKGFSSLFNNKETFDYWRLSVSAPNINSVKKHARLWEVLEEAHAKFTGHTTRFGSMEFSLEEKYAEKIGPVRISILAGGAHRAKQLFVRADVG